MKSKSLFLLASALCPLLAHHSQALAQGTAFTYQGRLNIGGAPANGRYDLAFTLRDAVSNGALISGPLTNSTTAVSNGLFTVALDFGASFSGTDRWLEIAVRPNGAGAFTTLSPCQQITPAPYAITAANLAGVIANNTVNATNFAAVAGGKQNSATGFESSIVGGLLNTASGPWTFIGGGAANTNSGSYGAIAGGALNRVDAFNGAVGGGYGNQAIGNMAAVPGGYHNVAGGDTSFAAGNGAQALHDGAFVWADSQPGTVTTTAKDQFLIRAGGGVGIDTASPAAPLHVNKVNGNGESLVLGGDPHAGGFTALVLGLSSQVGGYTWLQAVQRSGSTYGDIVLNPSNGNVGIGKANPSSLLDVNGTITCLGLNQTSDRNVKQDFTPISPAEVLVKVAALPLSEWSYTQDKATRHLGPMAQDFHAAFRLGTDDKHIATVDESGVALAAIQGLNQIVKDKDAEIQQLDTRLKRLEQLVQSLSEKN